MIDNLFVVGCKDNRGSQIMNLEQKLDNVMGIVRVKIARRLGCNNHFGTVDKSPCDCHSLLFSS
jgi:hypothetical protein